MKHLKLLFLTVTATFVLNSCNSEDDAGSSAKEIKSESVSFLYKDINYHSTYKLSPDSLIIWDDSEVGKLYEELNLLPELATLINNDGTVSLFDNQSELKHYISELNQTKTRAAWYPEEINFTLWVYENNNRQGAALKLVSNREVTSFFENGYYVNITNFGLRIPNLVTYNFNDRISSLYFTCTVPEFTLFFYENINYGGKVLCLQGPFNEYSIQDLKDYILQKPDFSHSTKTWNDQISSLEVSFYGLDASTIWG